MIEELSPETVFNDPCRTIIMKNFVCELCSHTRDLDLCRDKKLINNKWSCPECGNAYDKDYIEFVLIEKIKQTMDFYYTQDLQCLKCRNQKSELTFGMCSCGGEFKETFTSNFFIEKTNIRTVNDLFSTIRNISNYYSFSKLEGYLSNVMDK